MNNDNNNFNNNMQGGAMPSNNGFSSGIPVTPNPNDGGIPNNGVNPPVNPAGPMPTNTIPNPGPTMPNDPATFNGSAPNMGNVNPQAAPFNNGGVENLNNQVPNASFGENNNNSNPGMINPAGVNQNEMPQNNGMNTGMNNANNGYYNPIPAPSFTNPQTIMPGPMPGFESSNVIGTTPPISLEPEQPPKVEPQAKSKKNKTLFIIIIIAVLAMVGFGTYYVLNYTNLINKNAKVATIDTKNFEINAGDELSTAAADYATITGMPASNCSVDTSKVDVNVPGTYEFTVHCGEVRKNGSITVIESTPINVATKTVYKTKGETADPKEFVKNASDEYLYEYLDEKIVNSDLNTPGIHTVTLKVSQNLINGKTVDVEARLVVLAYKIRGYLTCSADPVDDPSGKFSYTVSEQFALVDTPELENAYGDLAFEISTFEYKPEFQEEYLNNKATYNSTGQLTINGKTGDATFNDDSRTITLTAERDKNDLITEYGADNIQSYRTLLIYFKQKLKYNCDYASEGN